MNTKKILNTTLLIYTLSIFGSMAMMSIGSAIAFVGFVFVLVFDKEKTDLSIIFRNPLWLPSIILFLACAWSLIWAKVSGLSFYGMSPEIQFKDISKIWHLFFPFVVFVMFSKLEYMDFIKTIRVWLMAALCIAIFGIIQYYFPLYKPQGLPHLNYENYQKGTGLFAMLKGSYHATGLTGFHLSFATIFAFPTSVWLAFTGFKLRNEGFNNKTLFLGFFSIIFLITNVLTYSKTTWLAVPLLVLWTIFLALKGRIRYVLTAIVIVFALVGVTSNEFKLRFQGTDTIKERLQIWGANFEMIKSFPLFGVGWHHNSDLSEAYYNSKGMHGFVSHAHNNILDQWASTGLFGLLGYLYWNLVVVWLSVQVYRKTNQSFWKAVGFGFLGGWFCLHLSGMTQTNYWDAKVLHQISWVTAASLEMYRRMKRQELFRSDF